MNKEILKIKEKVVNVLLKHNVKKAAFFGSIVRDELTETSDLDLLIEFEGDKSLLNLVDLKLELEKCLNRKVDVITYNSLHPLLKERILKEQEAII
ncbi:nucleotidyltransferase family protein [Methanobacterium petrolearium]|uniref:nucleotidyltransferase family protein n=1 Tax=Methanobacterium petrolearium TaxID=710190 RepID=UPI001AE28F80|nr:nucleotidyltransferase family protein [Methanobacterium petrolearium]MBP1945727.1 putative nucleotidyltransferase [Methanobacterium petrolearium]BDZ71975.1 hypothetical protein GCM10025861_24920 [Methanobacterium petrolearium]